VRTIKSFKKYINSEMNDYYIFFMDKLEIDEICLFILFSVVENKIDDLNIDKNIKEINRNSGKGEIYIDLGKEIALDLDFDFYGNYDEEEFLLNSLTINSIDISFSTEKRTDTINVLQKIKDFKYGDDIIYLSEKLSSEMIYDDGYGCINCQKENIEFPEELKTKINRIIENLPVDVKKSISLLKKLKL
jgi:methionine synthase II (cobalamin-independent)